MASKTAEVSFDEPTGKVPLKLRCGKANNSVSWRAEQQELCAAEFGYQANVLKTNVQCVPSPIVLEDFEVEDIAGAVPLTPAQISSLRLKAEKARAKEIRQLKLTLPKFYTALLLSISMESKEEIRNHLDFANADLVRDANALWQTIVKTHLTEIHGDGEAKKALDKHTLRNKLADFKRQYDYLLQTLEAAGIDLPSNQDQAIDFIDTLTNAASMRQAYPATLLAAWRITNDWVGVPEI
jgi:hypothetical protein